MPVWKKNGAEFKWITGRHWVHSAQPQYFIARYSSWNGFYLPFSFTSSPLLCVLSFMRSNNFWSMVKVEKWKKANICSLITTVKHMWTIKTDFMDGFLFHTYSMRNQVLPAISPSIYKYMKHEQSINFVAEKPDMVTDELRDWILHYRKSGAQCSMYNINIAAEIRWRVWNVFVDT